MGSIYKITNTVNGKSYIGQTVHDAVKGRINDHLNRTANGSRLVKRAIEKYGKDAFTYEILHDGIIPEFLDTLEIEAIAKFNTVSPHGYNLTTGGDGSGGVPSEETRQKMSEANKGEKNPMYGKQHTEESRRKISEATAGKNNPRYGKRHRKESRRKISEGRRGKLTGENHPLYGKSHAEETRRKISEANKGKTSWNKGKSLLPLSEETRSKISEALSGEKNPRYGKPVLKETRQKISEANKGKTRSEETRQKMSESRKGRVSPLKGKKLSEETRQKMSEAKKGKNHPQYGKPLSEKHRRNISEAKKGYIPYNRSPYYESVRVFFLSLPQGFSLKEKQQSLHKEFNEVVQRKTLNKWSRKWQSLL